MRTYLSLGFPMGAEWLCVLTFLGLLAGAVVVAIVLVSRRGAPPRGSPMAVLPAVAPGRFRVSGVERVTKKDAIWECEADSEANARVKAELEGIIVTAVDRLY